MSLLQKRPKGQGDSRGGALAKQSTTAGGIAQPSEYRRQIDRAFDQLMREFDRDPIRALSTLPRRLESLTGNLTAWPAIDVAEDDKAVTLRVDVPGLDPNDINVEVSGNVLTIQGQRQDEWSENERGVRRRERISGSFARTITLPSYVDPAKADASYQNGTLTITIPKIEGKGPKRVPVTTT